jgi:hypothetical protein
MTASKNSGQQIAIKAQKPRFMAIARPSRETHGARASPTLVMAAP